jgi:hypothetical protein
MSGQREARNSFGDLGVRAALCAVLGLSLLAGRAEAALLEPPLTINVHESIVWTSPTLYPGLTLDATSLFETGYISDGKFQDTGSFGAENYSIVYPPNPASPPGPVRLLLPAVQINWGDSIAWQFGGSIATAVANIPVTACRAGLFEPPDPCLTASIGVDLVGGFAPIDLSGGVFAFDSAVQIGTWEIRVSEVPEPSPLMLLGVGFAALPAFRRWRAVALRR